MRRAAALDCNRWKTGSGIDRLAIRFSVRASGELPEGTRSVRCGLGGLRLRLFGEVLLRLADEVEAAGDADQVFTRDGAVGDRQRLLERAGDLRHLAVQLHVAG